VRRLTFEADNLPVLIRAKMGKWAVARWCIAALFGTPRSNAMIWS